MVRTIHPIPLVTVNPYGPGGWHPPHSSHAVLPGSCPRQGADQAFHIYFFGGGADDLPGAAARSEAASIPVSGQAAPASPSSPPQAACTGQDPETRGGEEGETQPTYIYFTL